MDKVDYTGMIVLHGDLFKFDEPRGHLIKVANPDNKQSIRHLFNGIRFTRALYDIDQKKIIDPRDVTYDALGKYQELIIPNSIIFNNRNLSQSDIDYYNYQSIIHRQGFHFVTRGLSDRLNGVLPIIGIDGADYVLDLKSLTMAQAGQPEKKFLFQPGDLIRSSVALYNTRTKSPVNINATTLVSPNDLASIKFPPLNEMDIVGFAEYHRLPSTELVASYRCKYEPQQMEIVKLSGETIVDLIKKKKVALEKQQNKNSAVEQKDIKKGKAHRRKL